MKTNKQLLLFKLPMSAATIIKKILSLLIIDLYINKLGNSIFSMAFTDSTDPNTQPYKYNGKKLDRKIGLHLYDYSARKMDNAVPRFTSVDPLVERYLSISPYAYVESILIRREYGMILLFILQ